MRNKWVWSLLVFVIAIGGNSGNLSVVHAQAPALSASAAVSSAATPADADANAGAIHLLVGRSAVLDVGSPISRVSLTSPDIADALVTTPNQLLINGKLPGTISMFVWDRGGSLKRYEVIVQRDLARLSEQVKQLFPGEQIDVQSNGKNIVLSGVVTNKDVIERAVNVAAGFVDKREEVVPLLQLAEGAPSNQVLLRVRFAEVSRSALSELGASLFTSATGIENTLARTTTQQFAAPGYDNLSTTKANSGFGSPVSSASGQITFSDFLNLFLFNEKYDLGVAVRALQSKGLFQSLAEPNLVAESGKEASFLAGGEFPVPVAQGSGANLAITVTFKEFGIRLNFTPTVIGNRVHLKVRPEVSTLDFANAVLLNGFRIPALSTRRTETELELQNHQTFAIAGLLNNTVNATLQKIPGIGDIPILGQLFRSKAAQKDQTELVVMITPEILPNNSTGAGASLPRTPETFMPPLPDKSSFAAPPPAPIAALPAPMPTAGRALTEREQKVVAEARRAEAQVQKKEQERAKLLADVQAKADLKTKQEQDKLARDDAKRQQDAAKKQQDAAKKQQDEAKKLQDEAKKQAQK